MKTWLITGCSTGIGRGIARAVLKSGDQAIVTARNIARIEDFAVDYPDMCLALSLDLIAPNDRPKRVEILLALCLISENRC